MWLADAVGMLPNRAQTPGPYPAYRSGSARPRGNQSGQHSPISIEIPQDHREWPDAGVKALKNTLRTLSVTFTALGSRSVAFFAQFVAALAMDRAARDTYTAYATVIPQNQLARAFPLVAFLLDSQNTVSGVLDTWTGIWKSAFAMWQPFAAVKAGA